VLAGIRFLFTDRLLRFWTPAFTLLDTAWTLIFASLPVLVLTAYDANPRILGWLFGALGGGALVGAFVAMRLVRRIDPLAMTAAAFLGQMTSMWLVAVPGPWEVPLAGMAAAGFFMSLVNAPMQALTMLRVPRALRAQALAASGVLQSTATPIGLLVAGWSLAHFHTRAVLVVVLTLQTTAVFAIVVTALAERSSVRSAPVDSPA
jgi:MFS family permease